MLVQEMFPDLAKRIFGDLRRLRRSDLAEQVTKLRIVDRCRCGSEACGTFHTEDPEFRNRKPRTDIILQCGAKLTEAGGRIVEIETLDPAVQAELRRLIP